MTDLTAQALAQDRTIDSTTTGRVTGRKHWIEAWFLRVDGRYYLTGTPEPRYWYANLLANPAFTFHLTETTTANLPARALPIKDRTARRAILTSITAEIGEFHDLEELIEGAPLVEVRFDR